jgi:hypothetical protein
VDVTDTEPGGRRAGLLDRSCLPIRGPYNSDWAAQERDTQLYNGLASLLSKAVTSE